MILTSYDIAYMVSFIFGVYILYRFMGIFFNRKNINKKIELISYSIYYILAVTISIFINIPIIMTIFNLISIFILSYNYTGSINRRLVSVVNIYIILMISELLAGFIIGLEGIDFSAFEINQYNSIVGVVLSRVISFAAVLICESYKNIKTGIHIPKSKWICIFLIPSSSIYIILIIFSTEGIVFYNKILITGILLFINFATFYLYDVVSENMMNKIEKAVAEEQNRYYEKQFHTMKNSIDQMDTLRHDFKNHIETLKQLVTIDEKDKAINHMLKISETSLKKNDIYVDTGNVVIDSIINFKINEAEKFSIKCNTKIILPWDLKLNSFEMTAILGNLMDNAIEANKKINEEKRQINFTMKYDRGRLFIRISNPYNQKILKDKNTKKLLTTKKDNNNHGKGMDSIKNIVEKNDGLIDIDYDNNIFQVRITLFYNKFEKKKENK
jgi:sensor histidine kinase YesM